VELANLVERALALRAADGITFLPLVLPTDLRAITGEVVPLKRVRGAHKAFLEFERAFESGSSDGPTLKVGIAHADAPERLQALRELSARLRPRAEIEVETMLGAVVGTHAGPGAVGFFWFDDAD